MLLVVTLPSQMSTKAVYEPSDVRLLVDTFRGDIAVINVTQGCLRIGSYLRKEVENEDKDEEEEHGKGQEEEEE